MGKPDAALAVFERLAAGLVDDPERIGGALWREAGRAALGLNNLDQAKQFLAQALKLAPSDPQVYSLMARLADQLNKPEEALAAWRRACELAPAGSIREYQHQLANALTQRGHDLEALAVWQQLVGAEEGQGDTVRIFTQMSELYARAGRYPEAEQAARQALERRPADERLQYQVAALNVERAELADYRRRGGVHDRGAPVDLEGAMSVLEATDAAEARRDLARALLLQGRVNQAIAGLNAYLASQAPDGARDMAAQRALGVAYRRTGAIGVSLDVLSTAVRLDPTDCRTTVELALTYIAAGRAPIAVTLLERLAAEFPADPILYYHGAVSKHATGRSSEAIDMLQQAIVLDSTVASWRRTLAGWLRTGGDVAAALPHAQAGVELGGEDASDEEQAMAHAELAVVYRDLGRTDEGIDQWQLAVGLVPERAEWQIALGCLLLAAGRPQMAVDCFAQAAQHVSATAGKLGPSSRTQAALFLGWSEGLIALRSMDEAGIKIQRALDMDPDLPAAHATLGRWQAADNRWKDALSSFQTALLLTGSTCDCSGECHCDTAGRAAMKAGYLIQIARAYHALGSSEQALQELERAVQHDATQGEAFALMGEIHQEQGHRDLVRQAYQQAAAVEPTNMTYTLRLARFLQDEGQLDQALDWLMKTISLRPTAELYQEAARVYDRRGQRGMQMESLYRSIALEPSHAGADYSLGLAHKQRKEYQAAIQAFEKAIDLEPGNQEAHKQLSAVLAISFSSGVRRRQG